MIVNTLFLLSHCLVVVFFTKQFLTRENSLYSIRDLSCSESQFHRIQESLSLTLGSRIELWNIVWCQPTMIEILASVSLRDTDRVLNNSHSLISYIHVYHRCIPKPKNDVQTYKILWWWHLKYWRRVEKWEWAWLCTDHREYNHQKTYSQHTCCVWMWRGSRVIYISWSWGYRIKSRIVFMM